MERKKKYMKDFKISETKYKVLKEIVAYINENNIIAFCDLCDYAAEEKKIWFRYLINNDFCYLINEYIESRNRCLTR